MVSSGNIEREETSYELAHEPGTGAVVAALGMTVVQTAVASDHRWADVRSYIENVSNRNAFVRRCMRAPEWADGRWPFPIWRVEFEAFDIRTPPSFPLALHEHVLLLRRGTSRNEWVCPVCGIMTTELWLNDSPRIACSKCNYTRSRSTDEYRIESLVRALKRNDFVSYWEYTAGSGRVDLLREARRRHDLEVQRQFNRAQLLRATARARLDGEQYQALADRWSW